MAKLNNQRVDVLKTISNMFSRCSVDTWQPRDFGHTLHSPSHFQAEQQAALEEAKEDRDHGSLDMAPNFLVKHHLSPVKQKPVG
jgi:hypothetical protein